MHACVATTVLCVYIIILIVSQNIILGLFAQYNNIIMFQC